MIFSSILQLSPFYEKNLELRLSIYKNKNVGALGEESGTRGPPGPLGGPLMNCHAPEGAKRTSEKGLRPRPQNETYKLRRKLEREPVWKSQPPYGKGPLAPVTVTILMFL